MINKNATNHNSNSVIMVRIIILLSSVYWLIPIKYTVFILLIVLP